MAETGKEARQMIASGEWRKPTAGLAPGYVQANLVVLPQTEAEEFAAFCAANPKACPVLDQLAAGNPHPASYWAEDADIRYEIPRYRVYENGLLTQEVDNLEKLWQADLVAFLIGCSFTFEDALTKAGCPIRHIECGCNVPMYKTTIACKPVGRFSGPMVVSMRPMRNDQVELAVHVTQPFSRVHGAPVHIGNPLDIGIVDINRPDFGDAVPIYPGETPVFWACGVTPQAVALSSQIPLMITHAPGHMFITDRLNSDLQDDANG